MNWDENVKGLRGAMDAKHAAREEALRGCRLLIQTCSKCIKHIHRSDFAEASRLLGEAKGLSHRIRDGLAAHPDLLYAGYLQDAEKEMVEASACLALISQSALPTQAEMGVGETSYMNGLGEAASELRRYVLDRVRAGDLESGERLLDQMELIYDDLTTFDYPDALTGGLRRTCDALRAVIERTRSDLTLTRTQRDLMHELQLLNQSDRLR